MSANKYYYYYRERGRKEAPERERERERQRERERGRVGASRDSGEGTRYFSRQSRFRLYIAHACMAPLMRD